MSDNPLESNPERDAEIEARAKAMWEADGSPEGQMDEFRERADEIVRMQSSGIPAQLPIDSGPMIEEASIQENLGEFPEASGADQGETRETPMTRKELDAGG